MTHNARWQSFLRVDLQTRVAVGQEDVAPAQGYVQSLTGRGGLRLGRHLLGLSDVQHMDTAGEALARQQSRVMGDARRM